jgi:hypothetical protein
VRFSDLGRLSPPRARTIGAIDASATLATPSAIANGTKTFQAAYAAADGSLAGTTAVAAGLIAGLPPGQVTQTLNRVLSAASSVEAGAAIGTTLFPGIGTGVGIAIGAISGIAQLIAGSPPANPQGEFRGHSERYCFPALPLTPTVGESASALAQQLLQPVVWPDYRQRAVGYQLTTTDPVAGDPAPSRTQPLSFSFGVGWVSPPGSTAASTNQAYYLAQAWMGGDTVSTHARTITGDPNGEQASFREACKQQAITALGSEAVYRRAYDLVTSWYLSKFSLNVGRALLAPSAIDLGAAGLSYSTADPSRSLAGNMRRAALWWKTNIDAWNENSALDFTYYLGNYYLFESPQGSEQIWQVQSWEAVQNTPYWSVQPGGRHLVYASLPDTFLIALCELACIVATNAMTSSTGAPVALSEDEADAAALHFAMLHAWLWKRGQVLDATHDFGNGLTEASLPGFTSPHPNFSRVIGIVAAKIKKNRKKAAAASAKAKAQSARRAAVAQHAAAAAAQQAQQRAAVATTQKAHAAALAQQAAASASLAAAARRRRNLALGLAALAGVGVLLVHSSKGAPTWR